MKTTLSTIIAVFILTLVIASGDEKEKTRIGVYDSRSIAIAFVGSEIYKKTQGKLMASKMAEHRKAKAEGNEKKVQELEAWGKAQQKLLHQQGFSTAPVDDILAHLKDQLPEIKKQAKVSLLISKWDTKALAKHKSAKQVDLTMTLLNAFKPTEKQKKSALEIQEKAPVPLEELEEH